MRREYLFSHYNLFEYEIKSEIYLFKIVKKVRHPQVKE